MVAVIVIILLQGMIVDVRPFGCFMEFDVEAEGGDKHKVYGMVHVSEMSWEYHEDARSLAKVLFFTTTMCWPRGATNNRPRVQSWFADSKLSLPG